MEYPGLVAGYYSDSPAAVAIRQQIEGQMQELIRELGGDRPIEARLLEGDPAHQIENLAVELGVDLLVMPTHGYGPFRRFVLGSVTTKVLHDVCCPVFTGAHIPHVAPFNRDPYKRIACAIDLREHSETVLRWAWDFARAHEEDLIVIHAAPLLDTGGAYAEWFPPDTRQALVRAAKEEVNELIEKVGCRAQVNVDSADPIRYVRAVADECYADVLVIGRTGDKSLLGRLRTHSYALIREAPCPVISV
jgi:nucleotide-binding universal stress UspA family protein